MPPIEHQPQERKITRLVSARLRSLWHGWFVPLLALSVTGCAAGPQVASSSHGFGGPFHELAANMDDDHVSPARVIDFSSLPFSSGLTSPRSGKARQLLARAETLYTDGQLAVAITTLRRLREVEPICTAGLALEAQIALDRRDASGCALAAQTASAAHPESAEIQLRAGSLLVQLGELRGGLLALEQAHRLIPNDSRVARSLAAAYVSMRNYPAAEMVLKSALIRTPSDTSLSVALARLSETEERWTHAVFYYDLTFDSRLNDPNWLARRAHSLFQAGHLDRAFSDFELCADTLRDREAWDSLWEFAETCRRLGHDEQARQLAGQLPFCPAPPQHIVDTGDSPPLHSLVFRSDETSPLALRRLDSGAVSD